MEDRKAGGKQLPSFFQEGTLQEHNGSIVRPQRICPSKRSPRIPWILRDEDVSSRFSKGPDGMGSWQEVETGKFTKYSSSLSGILWRNQGICGIIATERLLY